MTVAMASSEDGPPVDGSDRPPQRMELVTGAIAAGGGCVARAADGRVVFVRHSLPGERVMAEVRSETSSFIRADAVAIVEASPDRVDPPCPHAGPGRCGGCDWQHVALSAQRLLKSELVSEQLHRLAGVDLQVEVEALDGSADGLGWRTRVRFAVEGSGRTGLRRHRSHDIEPVDHCTIATPAVETPPIATPQIRTEHEVEPPPESETETPGEMAGPQRDACPRDGHDHDGPTRSQPRRHHEHDADDDGRDEIDEKAGLGMAWPDDAYRSTRWFPDRDHGLRVMPPSDPLPLERRRMPGRTAVGAFPGSARWGRWSPGEVRERPNRTHC